MKASFWHRTRRRPSFWLGLFVACFLAWAWWDSTRFQTWVQKTGRAGIWGIARADGITFVFDRAPNLFAYDGVLRFPNQQSARATEEVTFEGWGTRYVKIPDSLVFFSFVGLWVGWLALSDWRRKTRVGRVERLAEN